MLNRISYFFILLLLAVCGYIYVQYMKNNSRSAPRYTGVERCAVCHSAASIGAQLPAWHNKSHAQAFASLSSEPARALLANTGRRVEECLPCHTTIGRFGELREKDPLITEGVGCERCHGPGSAYSVYNTMLDRKAFLAAGGVVGSLQDCYRCHFPDPSVDAKHCPFQTQPFNADSAWATIRHPIPQEFRSRDSLQDLQ
jgi:hypothetical protein